MDLDAARAFVRDHHRAVLATTRRAGRPQLSPIACAVDDEGRVVLSTRETLAKTANLRREPHVSLCVLSDDWYGQWVQIDGSAEVGSLPDAMDGLVDSYRSVAGEHPDWDEYRAAMQSEGRVLVRITIERAGPDPTA